MRAPRSVFSCLNLFYVSWNLLLCMKLPINLDEDTSSRKNREFYEVWNYFKKRGMGVYGLERAECKACNSIYRCGGRYGTSTFEASYSKLQENHVWDR